MRRLDQAGVEYWELSHSTQCCLTLGFTGGAERHPLQAIVRREHSPLVSRKTCARAKEIYRLAFADPTA